MPILNNTVGGHATSIVFSELQGSPDKTGVNQGTVKYRPTRKTNKRVENVNSPTPHYIVESAPGMITMTLVQAEDLSWLARVINASLTVRFQNGQVLTATGVTLEGDPTELDLGAGTTSELSFGFVSASLT